jgi:uncharacterized membrane protein
MSWTSIAPTVLASFLASAVEFVEALTIVLAVGVVRGWRPALLGAGAGVAALGALVLLLGPSLAHVPLPVLQIVVGTLLLLFGLRWLRKAILRAAGILALHDEDAAYAAQLRAMQVAGQGNPARLDPVAFLAAFKSVFLEGLEVVFIVVALGSSGRLLWPAASGALLALAAVVALGVVLHQPLRRVPENTLKFCVGTLLSAFGTFWVGEGLGLAWVEGELALVALIGVFALAGLLLTGASARVRAAVGSRAPRAPTPAPNIARRAPGAVGDALHELLGLFVDDAFLAGGILAVLAVFGGATHLHATPAPHWGPALTVALLLLLSISAVRRAASAVR